jgi:hypothetical protein
MGGSKWLRISLRNISDCLEEAGYAISRSTVERLLEEQDYSLKGHRKEKESHSNHPDRNAQFMYIATQRAAFAAAGEPILSVDTKKKELIGAFKNAGRAWSTRYEIVNVHDFPSEALGRAVPYGIYDVLANLGSVFVGSSADTPQFAVRAIRAWWELEGAERYPKATSILLLGDGGGSNGYRSRDWKLQVQEELSDDLGLSVSVCHYPSGCSKWNPIEHRLFGPISMNWAGKVLDTIETLLAYIRGTQTRTGLRVEAHRIEGEYAKGRKVTDAQMESLNLRRHTICPFWNYTLSPRCLKLSTAQ